jgi:hypothetical protein
VQVVFRHGRGRRDDRYGRSCGIEEKGRLIPNTMGLSQISDLRQPSFISEVWMKNFKKEHMPLDIDAASSDII